MARLQKAGRIEFSQLQESRIDRLQHHIISHCIAVDNVYGTSGRRAILLLSRKALRALRACEARVCACT